MYLGATFGLCVVRSPIPLFRKIYPPKPDQAVTRTLQRCNQTKIRIFGHTFVARSSLIRLHNLVIFIEVDRLQPSSVEEASKLVMRSGVEPSLIQKRSRHAALVSSACFSEAGQPLRPMRQAAAVPFSWVEAPCRKHL